jgi:hypothetical protein
MSGAFVAVRREEPGPTRLLALLDTLPPMTEGITLLAPAGTSLDDLITSEDPRELRDLLDTVALGSKGFSSGLALFWSPHLAYAVQPPLAPRESQRIDGWNPAPLLDLIGRQHTIAVALLRRGGYAVGVFQGDRLLASKTGSRFVKNRHRKGGQSQGRFDRIREKQIDELFAAFCAMIAERLEPYRSQADALFLGGDRRTVQAFLKECRYPEGFGDRLQARFINTPEPRHDTLQLAYDMIWRSEWTELRAT